MLCLERWGRGPLLEELGGCVLAAEGGALERVLQGRQGGGGVEGGRGGRLASGGGLGGPAAARGATGAGGPPRRPARAVTVRAPGFPARPSAGLPLA